MNKAYTMEDWTRDRKFMAVPGQEISEEVYERMLNCVQPLSLPGIFAEQVRTALKISIHAGFLMEEAFDCDKDGQKYLAFGMNDYGHGKHYFYLGLTHAATHATFTGLYYQFECMNAAVEGLYRATEFSSKQEAIRIAADYEATLEEIIFDDGHCVGSKILYQPMLV